MLGMFHVETKSHLVSKLIMVSFFFNSILVCWQDEKLGSESTTQLITLNNELNKCNSRVPWTGHRSQSGPHPEGFFSEQQQSYLVVLVGDWSTQ